MRDGKDAKAACITAQSYQHPSENRKYGSHAPTRSFLHLAVCLLTQVAGDGDRTLRCCETWHVVAQATAQLWAGKEYCAGTRVSGRIVGTGEIELIEWGYRDCGV